MLISSMTALLVSMAGVAGMHLLGAPPQWRAMVPALMAAIIASALAGLPLFLARKSDQRGITLAGLAATVLHLLALIVSAAVVLFGHLAAGSPFVLWLCVMYLSTLVALVFCISRAIYSAPQAADEIVSSESN
jgi:hypothetical protein